MDKIPQPTKISVQPGEEKGSARIIIEPCYPGYGTTLGNALRRILLSSLPGAAVKAFKINGALHEFSSIDNVKEDLVEISLNLKLLRLRVYSDEIIRLSLNVKGEKKVTAKDITPNSDVEIVNSDLHIATLTDKNAELNMEILVNKGRGYAPTESREGEELEVGMIAIDSLYGPLKKIGYEVENVRVGQMTNWDRLILDITSDGTIDPKDGLSQAVEILIDQFTFIFEKLNPKSETAEVVEPAIDKIEIKAEPTEKKKEKEAESEKKDEAAEKEPEKKKEVKKRGRPRKKKDE